MSRVYTAERVAEAMDVSYRQLDYWLRQGWITPTPINGSDASATPGTGKYRVWVDGDIDTAVMFGRLVAAGFQPSHCGEIAEKLARGESARLVWGIVITHDGTLP